MKKALRETQTLYARWLGSDTARGPPTSPPARCHKHTDRTDYNTLRRS